LSIAVQKHMHDIFKIMAGVVSCKNETHHTERSLDFHDRS